MRKTFAAGGRDSSGMEPHGVPLRPPRSIPDHGEPGHRHCGGSVHELPSRYACVNTMGDEARCGFQLKKLRCDREITRDEAVQLLEHGRTEVLEGFRSQKGKPFKARIVIGPEGRTNFDFANKAK
jgi:hypothetical protein